MKPCVNIHKDKVVQICQSQTYYYDFSETKMQIVEDLRIVISSIKNAIFLAVLNLVRSGDSTGKDQLVFTTFYEELVMMVQSCA